MKKIFGISLIGVLAALPMMANAAVTDAEPAALQSGETASVATANPKYALAPSSTTDGNVATAGYVKGAYNAAIKGINAVQNEIDSTTDALSAANSQLSAVQDEMASDYATQSGVAATVRSASATGSFSGAEVSGSFSGASVTGSVTGEVSGTIPAMTDWGSSSVGTAPSTASLSSTSISGSAAGTMSGTAAGTTSGTVSVTSYVAS